MVKKLESSKINEIKTNGKGNVSGSNKAEVGKGVTNAIRS